MARKSVTADFIPDEYRGYHCEPRSVYGVEFSRSGTRGVRDAIADAAGYSMDKPLNLSMGLFVLIEETQRELRRRRGVEGLDDVYVHLCKELEIDYLQFEHNVPKLPTQEFVGLASRKFANLKLPTNEVQWIIQRKKWINLWFEWVERDCERRGCDEDGHIGCEDNYGRPNFWKIAKEIESHKRDRAKLLDSIDATPRGKSVRIANDALARIGIVGRHSPRMPRPKGAST